MPWLGRFASLPFGWNFPRDGVTFLGFEKAAEHEPIPGVELKKAADVLRWEVCQDVLVLDSLNLRGWCNVHLSPP
jgi:hypothetical protein